MPKSVCSRGIHPRPNPGMTRPPAIESTVAITLPRWAGLRIPAGVTNVPSSARSVRAANPANRVHASMIGIDGDCGP
jgi:hypothetical protein